MQRLKVRILPGELLVVAGPNPSQLGPVVQMEEHHKTGDVGVRCPPGPLYVSESSMKEIPLTKGCVALVDDADYERLMQHKWHAFVSRSGPRAVRNAPMIKGIRGPRIYMSRQIVDAPKGMDVDHRDHNTLNDQRANLRVCTRSQNMGNTRKRAGCSSRFKGVSWRKDVKKWQLHMKVNGQQMALGLFTDEVKAAQAYNKEALKAWGEFALLNEV